MSKWEGLSDNDINYLVANILYDRYERGDSGSVLIHSYTKARLCVGWKIFNPCNSWEQAGEIIKKYGISLIKLETLWMAITSGSGIESYLGEDDHPCLYGEGLEFKHENPLRAVAVLFLMMNEDKGNE